MWNLLNIQKDIWTTSRMKGGGGRNIEKPIVCQQCAFSRPARHVALLMFGMPFFFRKAMMHSMCKLLDVTKKTCWRQRPINIGFNEDIFV